MPERSAEEPGHGPRVPGARRAKARRAPTVLARAAAVCLGVGLIVLAVRHHANQRAETDRKPDEFLVNEATCYAAHPANWRHHLKMRDRPLVDDLVTDEAGFRIAEGWSHPTSPRCRILALGDSFTEGLWVRGDEAFPAQLEKLLNARGYSVRVDNGGMRGQTIHQERVAALGRWAGLHHDLVIVAATGNDLTDLVNLEEQHCQLEGPVPTRFTSAVRSYQPGMVTAVLGDSLQRLMADWHAPVNASRCTEAAGRYRDLLLDLQRTLQTRGQRLLLAPLGDLNCGQDEEWNGANRAGAHEHTNALLEMIRREGVTVADLRSILHQQEGVTLAPYDDHPSPKGHLLIAEALATALESQHLLDRCR